MKQVICECGQQMERRRLDKHKQYRCTGLPTVQQNLDEESKDEVVKQPAKIDKPEVNAKPPVPLFGPSQ